MVFEEKEDILKVTRNLISMLDDDIRVKVLIELSRNGPLSIRALSRRLKVNYRKIAYVLKQLKEYAFVEETVVVVSEGRKYRFYTISKDIKEVMLKYILNISQDSFAQSL
jgi:DNA-binding Lrp family transcriptional regulator